MTFGSKLPEFGAGATIVIGGSGGLGEASAKLLVERGATVSFTYNRNEARAEAIAKEINDAGYACHYDQLTVENSEAVAKYVDSVASQFGGISGLVFAAGPMVELRNIADQSIEDFWAFMQTDVQGFYNALRAVIPHMREIGGGSIVALGTIAQLRYFNGDSTSAAPKGAVLQLVRAIAKEEGKAGIRANFVVVGAFNAGIGLKAQANTPPEFFDHLISATAVGRWGDPAELAEAVAFLASNRASYISGHSLVADGGFSL